MTFLSPYERANKRPFPNFEKEASDLLSSRFASDLAEGESIRIEAFSGSTCVLLKSFVGNSRKAHVIELFIDTAKESDDEDSLALLIDFLDGFLKEFFAEDRYGGLPLDFSQCNFENELIWARQEFRNFEAESLADELLKGLT